MSVALSSSYSESATNDLSEVAAQTEFRPKASLNLKTPEAFYQAARELVPVLKTRVLQTEQLRRLPNATIADLLDSGVLEMMRPKRFGGAELDFHVMLKSTSILAEGCPSTAWVAAVYQSHIWMLSQLPLEGQNTVFGSGAPINCPGIFNGIGAKARPVEGGYMLSGDWTFGSGSPHSSWAMLGANIDGRVHDGVPESRLLTVPRHQFEVMDNWSVSGLRGTGSHGIKVTQEVFVPEYMTIVASEMMAGKAPGAAYHEGFNYRLPVLTAFNLLAAGPGIGIARGAIEEFKAKLKTRVRAFTEEKSVDNPSAHIRLAIAEADLAAAELLLTHTILELEADTQAGGNADLELRAKCRMVSGYVPKLCKKVVTDLVEASSAKVMFDGELLGRALRDITMLSIHFTLDFDGGTQNYGRVLIGLDPSNPMI